MNAADGMHGFLKLYRCPAHGLIESPTWHEDEVPEDSGWYCPINLTGKPEASHDGITDDVCGKTVDLVSVGAMVSVRAVTQTDSAA